MKPQILQGAYAAQFYVSRGRPTIYHAIISKVGSAEIISWVQCTAAEECEKEAIETLAFLNGEQGSKLLLFPPIAPKQFKRVRTPKKKSTAAAS